MATFTPFQRAQVCSHLSFLKPFIPKTLHSQTAAMAITLRHVSSARMIKAFEEEGLGAILDIVVEDPLAEERVQRIRAQLIAAMALYEFFVELNIPMTAEQRNSLDLLTFVPLLTSLASVRVLNHLRFINKLANEAKHQRQFRSRH